MHFAIVIKQDGTVPFDEGLAPEHRAQMIEHLVDLGHTLTHHQRPHPLHGGVTHVELHTGPHCKVEQDKRRAEAAQQALALDPPADAPAEPTKPRKPRR